MSGSSLIQQVTVKCPSCGSTHAPRLKAMTLALTCPKCHAYFRTGHWIKEVTKFGQRQEPVIPIGSKAIIKNVKYEVIGFVVKKERKYKYQWREYMLFNPYTGYAFLSEYNGHWNFIWPLEHDPRGGMVGNSFYQYGSEFHLYQKFKADVAFAKGEFLFDVVQITDSTLNYEYIAPPFLIGHESSHDSLLWFQGEYMFPDAVSSAFKLPSEKMPPRDGLGYTEPIIGSFTSSSLLTLSFILVGVALLIQIVIASMSDKKEVFRRTYTESELNTQKMVSTESFKMEGDLKSVLMRIHAPVSNDWLYADFSLVNEDDGSEYNFSDEIEYYSGVEEGYEWTEGSRDGEAYLSKIPGGNYHINIYPEFNYTKELSIRVIRDEPSYSNFFLVALALGIYPAYYFTRRYFLERQRWSESEYSPYDIE